jgi:CelD/BcsL family acetyltransferase involved in cellulose biosynthesis
MDPSDESWIEFSASKAQANIFHHPAWMTLLAECYGYRPFVAAVINSAGEIRSGVPMMEIHSHWTGKRWVSLPFSDHCAPLHDDDEALDRLIDFLVCLHQERPLQRVELRWTLPDHTFLYSDPHYVLHTLSLDPSPEQVYKRIQRKQRENIRSAENKGVRIEWGKGIEQLRLFYHLQCLTRRRHGLPVQPWSFFELLWQSILEQGLGFLLLAYAGDRCLAGGIFLHWGQTLTYKYAASTEESRVLRPNHLLTWTAVRWGCEHGYRNLDFGRSSVEDKGLRTFKNRWGAEEMSLAYTTLSSVPDKPRGNKVMSAMQRVIRASPLFVCRAAGELFYRHFG